MKNLMGNRSVTAAADPIGTRIFPVMDEVTAVQDGWAVGLAFFSTRTRNYESINGDNVKGWHQGDGMTYLENADWNQYHGNFWATVDSQRLPGTTAAAGSTPKPSLLNGSQRVETGATPAFIASDRKSMVMTQDAGRGQVLVSVSDPTQANAAGINVELGRPVASVINADPGVSVSQRLPTLKLHVATSGARGKTFHAVFGSAPGGVAVQR